MDPDHPLVGLALEQRCGGFDPAGQPLGIERQRQHRLFAQCMDRFEKAFAQVPPAFGIEAREGVTLHRISGILHRPQTEETRQRLTARLGELDPFTLASLEQTTSLAASLCIGLEALQQGADGDALWAAANLEEEWQADLWGRDEEAEARRDRRKDDFLAAMEFAGAVQGSSSVPTE